jgi:hypothetical protein
VYIFYLNTFYLNNLLIRRTNGFIKRGFLKIINNIIIRRFNPLTINNAGTILLKALSNTKTKAIDKYTEAKKNAQMLIQKISTKVPIIEVFSMMFSFAYSFLSSR